MGKWSNDGHGQGARLMMLSRLPCGCRSERVFCYLEDPILLDSDVKSLLIT